ncbi:ABC transporter permease [candidate division WOR-3 bacterium]|nr:ABC transporter permease [candidate division WOR-3 bacterium]MCK4528990.1 ABC transporter permease [candidate division WOR-3 bacterium]
MFVIREALIGLRRNGGMTFIAIGIMFFSLFLFGLFLVGTFNLFCVIRIAKEKVEINAFLKSELSNEEQTSISKKLKSIVGIESLEYVTKEQALEEFKKDIPNAPSLLEAVKTNPLPPSFKIKLKGGFTSPDKVEEVAEKVGIFKEIESVEYGETWINRLDQVVKILFVFDMLLGLVIGLSSIFVVSYTIRLTVLARRKTIEVMKLVGATERTIQAPFVLAGLIEGGVAGAISAGVLFLIYQLISRFFVEFYFPTNTILIGMVILGLFLGFVGSKTSVKSTSMEVSLEAPIF